MKASDMPSGATLEPAECELGYPEAQLERIVRAHGRSMYDFNKWIAGQTVAVCDGRLYDYETKTHKPCCKGVAHGGVVYGHDLKRFLDRRPIVDW